MVSLKPEERVGYIDFLNVFSCLGVIFLHHSNIFHTYSPTVAWVQALFIQVLFYWSVPIFLMLSGAMLLDYRKKV